MLAAEFSPRCWPSRLSPPKDLGGRDGAGGGSKTRGKVVQTLWAKDKDSPKMIYPAGDETNIYATESMM